MDQALQVALVPDVAQTAGVRGTNPNPSFKPTGFGRPLICGMETVIAWPPKTGGLTLR